MPRNTIRWIVLGFLETLTMVVWIETALVLLLLVYEVLKQSNF